MKTEINNTVCTNASQIIDVCGFCDSEAKRFGKERDKGKATLRSYQKSYEDTLQKEGNDFIASINKINKPSEKLDVDKMETVLTEIFDFISGDPTPDKTVVSFKDLTSFFLDNGVTTMADFNIKVNAKVNAVTFKKI